MGLGERIGELREKARLSQADLARLLFVSRQAVHEWETGGANPRERALPAIAAALGVTIDLLTDDGDIRE